MTDAHSHDCPSRPTLTEQVAGVLAFAGDLSMGQSADHSLVTACIAAALAEHLGLSADAQAATCQLGLLRWSGCTANAQDFSDLLGDDVEGRARLLAHRDPFVDKRAPSGHLPSYLAPMRTSHCEAAREIGRRLQLSPQFLAATYDLFEYWGGFGLPDDRIGDAIDVHAQLVTIAGDMEVWERCYGPARTALLLEEGAGQKYDPALVLLAIKRVLPSMAALRQGASLTDVYAKAQLPQDDAASETTMAELLADYVDLKRPVEMGFSRRVAQSVGDMAMGAGLPQSVCEQLMRAALMYRLGQVSVSNAVLNAATVLPPTEREEVRLIPYWTERMLHSAPAFDEERRLASFAFERLDGSGFYRGAKAAIIPMSSRILQVAIIVTSQRYDGQPETAIHARLHNQVQAGQLDAQAVACVRSGERRSQSQAPKPLMHLAAREQQVLEQLSRGHSNKVIARQLGLSPKTVGTYVENLYRKLEVSSRAAAVLRAMDLGLLAIS